jgi:O-antigen/teichoic acid export membrane protein
MPGIGAEQGDPGSSPTAATSPPEAVLADPGAVRNTLLQLASQIAATIFTGGLTLYLVRTLGASGYGVYALAVSIGGLLLLPAGLGLPWALGRFLADHIGNLGQVRAILVLGLRLQVPAAVVTSVGLFAAAGAIADGYGQPHLGWPLRWVALSLLGQALFGFLTSVATSVRRVAVGLWMALIESATETFASIALVLAGSGAAGAALGKAIGYGIGAAAGFYLTLRLLGGLRRQGTVPVEVGVRAVMRYAGAMLVVDAAWSAIAQIDILLIGALLTSAAVGSFGAVARVLTVVGYLGIAVSSGVAPRLSLGGGAPDTRAFNQALRYLILAQGLVIAPLVVWSTPIVHLLLGPGYGSAGEIMKVLTLAYFVGAPASLVSVTVTYLGEARRRLIIMIVTLVVGVGVTYVLLEAVGVVGAAIADDLIQIVYIAANLWICSLLITVDLQRLAWSTLRTLLAAGAMALAMAAIGTEHLSVLQWIGGGCAGGLAYGAVLLLTRELSVAELRAVAARLRVALHRTAG